MPEAGRHKSIGLSGFALCLPAHTHPDLPLAPHLLCCYLSLGNHHSPACPDKLQSLKLPGSEERKEFLLMCVCLKGILSHAKYSEEGATNAYHLLLDEVWLLEPSGDRL